MTETHPFSPFIPQNVRRLLLGSFPGHIDTRAGQWYYETKRGQFWRILKEVYGRNLATREEKEKLLSDLGIGLSDVIYECERIHNNNSDTNLKVITYNTKIVEKILKENNIERIYFSSRFVEKIFKSKFKSVIKNYSGIELITLPSSSPRYAKMSLKEKIGIFRKILPTSYIQ